VTRAILDSCRSLLDDERWIDCIHACRRALALDLEPAQRAGIRRIHARAVAQLESAEVSDLSLASAYWQEEAASGSLVGEARRDAYLSAAQSCSMLASALMRDPLGVDDGAIASALQRAAGFYEQTLTFPGWKPPLRGSIHAQAGLALAARGRLSRAASSMWSRAAEHFKRALRLLESDDDQRIEVATAAASIPTFAHGETSSLVTAAGAGNSDEVVRLLRTGADPDETDATGNTAMHVAAGDGRVAIVKALLDAGADRSALDNDGATALHWSVLADRAEVLSLLLEDETRVDQLDYDGRTPLSWATSQLGGSTCARLLVEAGSDVNLADHDLWLPLHHACSIGDISSVSLLLQGTSDVESRTVSGETAASIALREGHESVAKILNEKLPH
jgi:ankyrin repeat protein